MKILILASNPRKDLNLDREIRELKHVIERSRNREQFEVEDALAVRVGDLQDLLLENQPHIVHICGHGGGTAGLVLEDDDGREQWVGTEALRDLFRLFSSKVRCVLLNACYSNEQANEIVNCIDYVIGMEQEIRDDAAIAFSKGFYRALGYGCSVEEAYAFGCNAIQLEITNRLAARSPTHRSAAQADTPDLTRKAEVVEAVKTTIIPEHLKPILKKRQGLSLGNVWQPQSSPSLPQEKKEEIQWELAQELISSQPESVQAQPEKNSDRISQSQAQSQPSYSLLEVPASRRRRTTPLLIVSIVGILAGLLSSIGIYTYRQRSLNQTEPSNTEQAQVLPPSAPAESPNSELPSKELSDQELLEQAKEFANKNQWKEAIAVLAKIPADSPVAEQTKAYLTEWSDSLLKRARELYDQGDLDGALIGAQGIPDNSPNHEQAKAAIAAWTAEKETGNKIQFSLTNAWDVQGSRQLLSTIQSPGFLEKMKADIAAIEVKILANAQELYADGNRDEALQKAQIIPEGSPSYLEAQRLIAAWKEIERTPSPSPNPTPTPPVPTQTSKPSPPDNGWFFVQSEYGWLSERLVTEEDLQGKTAIELDILRNSLFARYGLRFNNPELRAAFEAQPWYQPTGISFGEVYNKMSELERQNFRAICKFQKERNPSLS
ncbi:YARHG domain-containing protein, partial [Leptolyngbya sp. FACHB-711]